MPFIWYDLTAMWPWRILRAAQLRLRPISTHASSHRRGRNSVACVVTTAVACSDRPPIHSTARSGARRDNVENLALEGMGRRANADRLTQIVIVCAAARPVVWWRCGHVPPATSANL